MEGIIYLHAVTAMEIYFYLVLTIYAFAAGSAGEHGVILITPNLIIPCSLVRQGLQESAAVCFGR